MSFESWKKKINKISRLITIVSLLFFIVFIAIATFLYFKKDKFINYAINQINKYLEVEVKVNKIDLSFLSSFPYVSIVFDNVYIPEKNFKDTDTLLYAANLYLSFHFFELLRGNYVVRQVKIKDAVCKLKIFNDKTVNYKIWKTDTVSDQTSFFFDLQKVLLKNVSFSYQNFVNKIHFKSRFTSATLKGDFSDDNANLKYFAQGIIINLMNKNDTLLRDKTFHLKGTLSVGDSYRNFLFHKTSISIQNVKFQFEGQYSINKADAMHLILQNEKVSFSDIVNLLPPVLQSYLNKFVISGKVRIFLDLRGTIDSQTLPGVYVNITLTEGSLMQLQTRDKINNINCEIRYYCKNLANINSSEILFDKLSMQIGSGFIESKITINNLKNSNVQAELKGQIDLFAVPQMFFYLSKLKGLKGLLNIESKFELKAADIFNIQKTDLVQMFLSGHLSSDEIIIPFEDSSEKIIISQLNGNYNNNLLQILSAKINYANSDFEISVKSDNLMDYLLDKKKIIHIDGSVFSKNLNIRSLFKIDTITTNVRADTLYDLSIPSFLSINLKMNAENIVYDKFQAKNFDARLIYSDNTLLIRDVRVDAFDGQISGEVIIDARRGDAFMFNVLARFNEINIQKAFLQLNNFGQQSITDKNLSGKIQGVLHLSSKWHNNLRIDPASIALVADIKIFHGAIRNYLPLMGLKQYFRRRDFSNVTFDTLHNEIQISDRTLIIPRMYIQSNVINFQIEGTHTFDNNIDYRFQIHFSDLLGYNKNKNYSVEKEYGYVIETEAGPNWFFRVTGTVDNPKFMPIDFQAMKQHRKEKILNEKEQIQQVIQNEFKLTKEHIYRLPEHESSKQKQLIFEWTDE